MDGLKIIAQSTFDKHQKFRTSEGPQRYNVIEIGAFGSSQSAESTTASKLQSTDRVQNLQSASETGAGSDKHDGAAEGAVADPKDAGEKRVSFNEWVVYEDDLVAFMKMRPVEPVASAGAHNAPQKPAGDVGKGKSSGKITGSAATSATGHSRSVSLQSSKTVNTTTTAATSATGKMSERSASKWKEEVEAAASVKLICVPCATLDGDSETDLSALAISREAFLRLYVDTMDADHGALYFLARGYDGFHEYNDASKETVTIFIGTADYALIWTFRRRTLETKGLFIDRKRPQQPKDPGDDSTQRSASTSRKSSKRGTATVGTSNAWLGFREMLRMYKSYIYAPHLLSFVSCLHMIHAFDEQVSASDVPQVKEIEKKIGNSTVGNKEEAEERHQVTTPRPSIQAVSRQSSTYTGPVSTQQSFVNIPTATPRPYNNERLVAWAQASGEITDSVSRKLRQLKMAREVLDVIAREHETVIADVVAPDFLDRYHWAMEGINEAIPAVERHMVSLEESMHDLKARTERLNGLRALDICTVVRRTGGGESRFYGVHLGLSDGGWPGLVEFE
ncbi:hypothetical protein VMCG_06696 [Cytospora schulzeri]|uniref:Uncharacterized protein n=1 Tax=Cytospora schulzeri TaxID=448051 RepID=A0A423W6W7_9PEZI|nr:hypothetical protein VMCG_06696 [Valsa malicola]